MTIFSNSTPTIQRIPTVRLTPDAVLLIIFLFLIPLFGSSQPSLPYYGNWCGIGHGAGHPIDELDCACMDHDIDYDGSNYQGRLASSDQRLVARAKRILNRGSMIRYAPLNGYANYRGRRIIAYRSVGSRPLSSAEREKLRGIIAYGTSTQIATYPHQVAMQNYNYARNVIRRPSRIYNHTATYARQQLDTNMGVIKSGGAVLENTTKSVYNEGKRTLRKLTGIKF